MVEELQNLLERIQKDGVDKAEAEAGTILEKAKTEAAKIIEDAKQEADALIKKADHEASAFSERASQSLLQSARDVILSIGQALNNILEQLVLETVSPSFTEEALKQMIATAVEAYCQNEAGTAQMSVLLTETDQKALSDFLMSRYSAKLRGGVDIRPDKSLAAGFRISVDNNKVQHDFSSEAISEAMSQLLRPRLAEIVQQAAQSASTGTA